MLWIRLRHHQRECGIRSLPLAPYFIATFILSFSFIAGSLGVLALRQGTEVSYNPFAKYAAVFPGQPISAAVARGFRCTLTPYAGHSDAGVKACVLLPETGTFSQIIVTVYENTIEHILFTVRNNRIKIGDLVLLCGAEGLRASRRAAYFFWGEYKILVSVAGYTGQFSFQLPIETVYLQRAQLFCINS